MWAKPLTKSIVTLGVTGIKFDVRGINVLAGPEVIFISTGTGVNDYLYWLIIWLIYASNGWHELLRYERVKLGFEKYPCFS